MPKKARTVPPAASALSYIMAGAAGAVVLFSESGESRVTLKGDTATLGAKRAQSGVSLGPFSGR
jgi:hypothetical protein